MSFFHRIAIACLAALVCIGAVRAQESKEQPPSEEDGRMDRIIERWIEQNESERDVVVREVSRGNNGKADEDYDKWYERLGGTEEGWDRTRIERQRRGEIFDRMAWRLGAKGPTLTRDQFISYAKQHWRKDKSPLWREPPRFDTAAEAERVFKHLDRDKDNYLNPSEIPPALRGDMKRWDKDQDGWISANEYRVYFSYRLDQVFGKWQQKSERPLPALELTVPADDEKTPVIRVTRLPLGLPAWFGQVDTDKDGQIGLYEWRVASWPIDEFEKLDLNHDGFLEPSEILRLLAVVDREGRQTNAYLLQKRVGAKSK